MSAKVALIEDLRYREHAAAGHPERPERLSAISAALAADSLLRELPRRTPQPANDDTLALAHSHDHVARVGRIAAAGGAWLDPDTYCTAASDDIARLAVGGATAAADAVMSGEADHAFALVRPPGHHATAATAMGFCLYNNAAIVIRYLQGKGARRVAVVDIDVHHGNGTEAIVWDDATVLYTSLHQAPFYPGTGAAEDRGAHGNVVNVPLPAGTDGNTWLRRLDEDVLPAIAIHQPDIIVVSAGYDGHRADPLAGLRLETATYGETASRIAGLGRPSVWLLEGGYDLAALAASVAASLHGLIGTTAEEPGTVAP